jgi:hypothetical protein
LGILGELAVDFPRREQRPVEKNLDLHHRGIHFILGRRLGAEFGVVDRSRIQAGRGGGKRQRAQQKRCDEQAGHPSTSNTHLPE